MENEGQVCAEVYTILKKLPAEYTNRIPQEIKSTIFQNADTSYECDVDELAPKSKAIIIEIIRRYFSNQEITEKINEYIDFNLKLVNKHEKKYNQEELFNTKTIDNSKNVQQTTEDRKIENNTELVVVEKETIFSKIIKKFKNLFNIK